MLGSLKLKRRTARLLVMAIMTMTIIVIITSPKFSTPWSSSPSNPDPYISTYHMKLHNLTLECEIPDAPRSVPKLKVSFPSISSDTAWLMATSIFNFSARSEMSRLGDCFLFKEGGRFLRIRGLYSIHYTVSEELWKRGEEPPAHDKARAIVVNFINKLRGVFPTPPNFSFREVRTSVAYTESFYLPNGTKVYQRELAIAVDLEYELFNMRLWGPGADSGVWIGPGGDVVYVGLNQLWAEETGRIRIIPPGEAIKRLKEGYLAGPCPLLGPYREIIIKEMFLAYYVDGKQEVLPPVYCFKGVVVFEYEGSTFEDSVTLLVSAM